MKANEEIERIVHILINEFIRQREEYEAKGTFKCQEGLFIVEMYSNLK